MSLSYFNVKKLRRQSKQSDPAPAAATTTAAATATETATSPPAPAVTTPGEEPAASPILDDEDQKFLERLAAISQEPEGTPPPLPERPAVVVQDGEKKRGRDAQEALMNGAEKVPLPMSPPEVTVDDTDKQKAKESMTRKKSVMSYFSLAQAKFKQAADKDKSKERKKEKISDKDRHQLADNLLAAAAVAKTTDQKEVEKENADITAILDDLNLSAVNNRVFSFTKESEELFAKFTLVLKDIVNGAPTAYDDLQKLFTDYDSQLKKMYGGLPPFLQNMVKSLPAKITATLGPEILAAQAEKPGFDAKAKAAGSAGKSKFRKPKLPSLKNLLTVEGAVATMLRSILNFLKLRFPAVLTGTNVVMSLAVCLLLFVFWYCHKRGRESRLDKERLAAEGAGDGVASSASSFTDDGDSVFGNKKAIEGEASRTELEDMPSVRNLPDPGKGKGKEKELA
ncbi:hypothetical protein P280DRAFT_465897 [Massarina eburnea CBS 473.64]|uniref:Ring-like domain-containing protein n=1 Tax=Massarina eburnea CBS 473.64 TaxID=1395130 RepID=A0A6A6SA29_9PLEO|nr:hypothetical protein P280DRAFT_465897 [Massarina eburnea CBS 473.64]